MVVKNIGDTVLIDPTVTNTSNVHAYFDIQYFLNETLLHTSEQYPMPAGSTGHPGLPFHAEQVGTFDVTVKVLHNSIVLDSKTVPEGLIVQEPGNGVCPLPHEAIANPQVYLWWYYTRSDRAETQTFYPDEQIYGYIVGSEINKGDVVRWEIGYIDAQGNEQMWPGSAVEWIVPEQVDPVTTYAFWPAEAGTYTWTILCPYIIKVLVNGSLVAKLYFQVVSR